MVTDADPNRVHVGHLQEPLPFFAASALFFAAFDGEPDPLRRKML
jgi:hypothetical protein